MMIIHAILIAIVLYVIMLYALKQPAIKAQNRSVLTFNLQNKNWPGDLYYFVTTSGNKIMLKFMWRLYINRCTCIDIYVGIWAWAPSINQ